MLGKVSRFFCRVSNFALKVVVCTIRSVYRCPDKKNLAISGQYDPNRSYGTAHSI
jgi:hypothetical protein